MRLFKVRILVIASVLVVSGSVLLIVFGITDVAKTYRQKKEFQKLSVFLEQYHNYINAYAVFSKGELVYDDYFNGLTEQDLQLCASVTKTFTSLLTGIAIDQGYLTGTDQSIFEIFADHPAVKGHARERDITIDDLLTMRSGIPYDLISDMRNWIHWKAPLDTILEKTLLARDEQSFRYNDPGCHLLIYIIEKTSGMSIQKFAEINLFNPLEIYHYEWQKDNNGRFFGSHGLSLTTTDMAKAGLILLQEGRWKGNQVVSTQWIDRMTQNRLKGGFPYFEQYGYLLFLTQIHDMDALFAVGYGGQFVIVIPEIDLVTAFHCNIYTNRDRIVRDLVNDHILPIHGINE